MKKSLFDLTSTLLLGERGICDNDQIIIKFKVNLCKHSTQQRLFWFDKLYFDWQYSVIETLKHVHTRGTLLWKILSQGPKKIPNYSEKSWKSLKNVRKFLENPKKHSKKSNMFLSQTK